MALLVPVPAGADHATRQHTQNVHAMGHSAHFAPFLSEPDGVRHIVPLRSGRHIAVAATTRPAHG